MTRSSAKKESTNGLTPQSDQPAKRSRHRDNERFPNEPTLTPTYGVKAWSNRSTCEDVHPHGPLPEGSRVFCEACCKTGIEGHPVFAKDAMDRNGSRVWPTIGETKQDATTDGLEGGKGKGRRRRKAAQQSVDAVQ